MTARLVLWLALAPLSAVACEPGLPAGPATDPPDPVDATPLTALDSARLALRSLIENVPGADAHRYGLTDDRGRTMDCLKIIPSAAAGGFIGVYHVYNGAGFDVYLATSTNLLDWTAVRRLGTNASQPTIAAAGEGFVVAWEQEPQNHLHFAYFSDWSDLRAGSPAKTFDAAQTLSPCAEGTPNLYSASESAVAAGFHYYADCDVDRQASGATDWSSWSAAPEPELDSVMLGHGLRGNIGDRDGPLLFHGQLFTLIEGQYTKGDFGSWRVFLLDEAGAHPLTIRTHSGSTAFGNPTFAEIELGGRRTLVVTLFLFGEGARAGEGGPLVYYHHF